MAKIWVGRTTLHGEKRGDGLSTENKVLERVEVFKLLGVQVQRDLKQIEQFIDDIAARANKQLYFLCVCHKANLPTEVGLATYITKICPFLEYPFPIWGGLPKYLADNLQWIQNRSMDILGLSRYTLESLDVIRDKHTVQAFNGILVADDHPCKRFINEIMLRTPFKLNEWECLYHAPTELETHSFSSGQDFIK